MCVLLGNLKCEMKEGLVVCARSEDSVVNKFMFDAEENVMDGESLEVFEVCYLLVLLCHKNK